MQQDKIINLWGYAMKKKEYKALITELIHQITDLENENERLLLQMVILKYELDRQDGLLQGIRNEIKGTEYETSANGIVEFVKDCKNGLKLAGYKIYADCIVRPPVYCEDCNTLLEHIDYCRKCNKDLHSIVASIFDNL